MRRSIETMARAREDGEWRYAWGVSQGGRVLAWSEPVHRTEHEARAAGERFLGVEVGDGDARSAD